MLRIKGLLRRLTRPFLHVLFKPLLRTLGYKPESLNLGLPESIYFKNQDGLRTIRRLHQEYLRTTGWIESKNANQAIRDGEYLPWTSYAFTHWFDSRDVSKQLMLEFGSGASTLYWAASFKNVISVESDLEWFTRVKNAVANKKNITLHSILGSSNQTKYDNQEWESLKDSYDKDRILFPEVVYSFDDLDLSNLASVIPDADWIFIDGGPRNFYTEFALIFAKPGVIFVLDNSDEEYTLPARASLIEANFVEIPFHSLGPLNPFSWTTSIFITSLGVLK